MLIIRNSHRKNSCQLCSDWESIWESKSNFGERVGKNEKFALGLRV